MDNYVKAPFHKDYKDGGYRFPSKEVSNEEKETEAYAAKNAEAIYSLYNRNDTAVGFSNNYAFHILRLMARGKQPEDWYMPRGDGGLQQTEVAQSTNGFNSTFLDSEQFERGFDNIDWDVVSPAPKIMRMMLGLLAGIKKDITVTNIDADSGAEEEQAMFDTWVRAKYAEEINKAIAVAGLSMDQPDIIPDSMEELQILRDTGKFKLQYARVMEKLIKHTEELSRYPEIHEDLIRDVLTLNVCGAKSYYCEQDKKIKYRYVDPQYSVFQWSSHWDYKDIEYAGEINYDWTVSKLLETGNFTRDELCDIAKKYKGIMGNPVLSEEEWDQYAEMQSDGTYRYDNFKVAVMDCEWIDIKTRKRLKFTNKYGTQRNIPYSDGRRVRKNEELMVTNTRKLYHATWLIGSERCVKYGFVENQEKNPKLSYKFIKFEEKSIIQQISPFLHNIQMNWLKWQNALSMVFDKGYAIDVKMLDNIKLGGDDMDAQDIIEYYKRTGLLFYRSTMPGQFYKGGNVVPIQEIEGGLGSRLKEAFDSIQFNMRMIEDITGLSSVALGSAGDDPVKNTQLSLNSTHQSLNYLLNGVFRVREYLAEKAANRISLCIRNDKKSYKEYADVVGINDVDIIKMAEKQGRKYGSTLISRPTDEQKQILYNWINEAMTPGRDGVRDISIDTAIELMREIEDGGNIKEVEFKLKTAVRRNKEQARKQAMENMQMQSQQQAQLAQQQAQSEQAKIQGEAQADIAIENVKSQNNMKQRQLQSNLDYLNDLRKQAAAEDAIENGTYQKIKELKNELNSQ